MNVPAKLAQLFTLNGLVWLPLLVGLAGIIYLSAAVFFALTALTNGAVAALISGLMLLLIAAGLAWGVVRLVAPAAAKLQTEQESTATEQAMRPLVGDAATNWFKANTATALVGAVAAGALVAASPQVRHLLVRSLGPLAIRGATKTLSSLAKDN